MGATCECDKKHTTSVKALRKPSLLFLTVGTVVLLTVIHLQTLLSGAIRNLASLSTEQQRIKDLAYEPNISSPTVLGFDLKPW